MAKIGYTKDSKILEKTNNMGFSYAILEKIDEISFEAFNEKTDYSPWDKGRIFGEKAELKWQKINGKYHLVLITDEDSLPPEFTEFPCSDLKSIKPKDSSGKEEEREIFLWGIKDNCIWFEDRIPILLKYPVIPSGNNKRVKVLIKEYQFNEKDPESDENTISNIHRFVKLLQE